MTFLIRHGKAVTRTAATILELRALQHPHPRRVERATGTVLIGLGVRMALSKL